MNEVQRHVLAVGQNNEREVEHEAAEVVADTLAADDDRPGPRDRDVREFLGKRVDRQFNRGLVSGILKVRQRTSTEWPTNNSTVRQP